MLTLPRQEAHLTAPSPIPADPGDDSVAAVDALGLTQPIDLSRTAQGAANGTPARGGAT